MARQEEPALYQARYNFILVPRSLGRSEPGLGNEKRLRKLGEWLESHLSKGGKIVQMFSSGMDLYAVLYESATADARWQLPPHNSTLLQNAREPAATTPKEIHLDFLSYTTGLARSDAFHQHTYTPTHLHTASSSPQDSISKHSQWLYEFIPTPETIYFPDDFGDGKPLQRYYTMIGDWLDRLEREGHRFLQLISDDFVVRGAFVQTAAIELCGSVTVCEDAGKTLVLPSTIECSVADQTASVNRDWYNAAVITPPRRGRSGQEPTSRSAGVPPAFERSSNTELGLQEPRGQSNDKTGSAPGKGDLLASEGHHPTGWAGDSDIGPDGDCFMPAEPLDATLVRGPRRLPAGAGRPTQRFLLDRLPEDVIGTIDEMVFDEGRIQRYFDRCHIFFAYVPGFDLEEAARRRTAELERHYAAVTEYLNCEIDPDYRIVQFLMEGGHITGILMERRMDLNVTLSWNLGEQTRRAQLIQMRSTKMGRYRLARAPLSNSPSGGETLSSESVERYATQGMEWLNEFMGGIARVVHIFGAGMMAVLLEHSEN